jgi:hypothetical protein
MLLAQESALPQVLVIMKPPPPPPPPANTEQHTSVPVQLVAVQAMTDAPAGQSAG